MYLVERDVARALTVDLWAGWEGKVAAEPDDFVSETVGSASCVEVMSMKLWPS